VRPIPALEGLIVGVALAAIGGLWTLSNFGRLDLLATLRTYWPSLLVLWGGLELYNWGALRAQAAAAAVSKARDDDRWFDQPGDMGGTS